MFRFTAVAIGIPNERNATWCKVQVGSSRSRTMNAKTSRRYFLRFLSTKPERSSANGSEGIRLGARRNYIYVCSVGIILPDQDVSVSRRKRSFFASRLCIYADIPQTAGNNRKLGIAQLRPAAFSLERNVFSSSFAPAGGHSPPT